MQRIRQVSCVVLALKKAGFYRCGIIFFLFCRRLRPKNSSTYSTRLRLGSLRISQNFKGGGGGGGLCLDIDLKLSKYIRHAFFVAIDCNL